MYTEEQTIRALKRLEKNWPSGYMLLSWSGSLCLIRKDLIPNFIGGLEFNRRQTGSYNDAIIETFHGIPSDGGDPD